MKPHLSEIFPGKPPAGALSTTLKKLNKAPNVLNIYKSVGETPFEQVQKLKSMPELEDTKIGYAGRLDPMAEGVMLYLTGKENKNAKVYQKLDKDYEFEVLFGMSTDTYDALGILTSSTSSPINENQLAEFIKNLPGKQVQQYPPYSYLKINGKSLFKLAREGKLGGIVIPSKEISVNSLRLMSKRTQHSKSLKNYILNRIKLVQGDFRQKEIIDSWENFFKKNEEKNFNIYKFNASVSSGAYIRSIANQMGKSAGTGAIALNIVRTRVGEFNINNSQRI